MRTAAHLPPFFALFTACASPAIVSTPDAAPMDVATPMDVAAPMDAAAPPDVTPDVAPAGDGPLLPPTDAPPLLNDAGALGEPPWVALEVRTTTSCPPLAPCGGVVAGTWDVAGGCFDLPVPADLMRCPGARVTRATGRARGRVTFGPIIADRAAQWEVEAELAVPAVCASFVGGCAGLQAAVRGAFPDSACAAEGAAGDCRCAVRQTGALRDGDGYTTRDNQIVSATAGRRWNYCVTGDRLRYRDASAAEPREPGTIELLRRAP